MQVTIRAIGRIRSGPERSLVDDYLQRCDTHGRSLGLGPFEDSEIDSRSLKSARDETLALLDKLPENAVILALDERGKTLSSPQFANRIQKIRDEGNRHLVFLIGGADGFEQSLLPSQVSRLSLGNMVWPHKLVRVMLAEQLYRAVSLMAGTPYHRE